MEAARRIRSAVAEVSLLRQAVEANPVLAAALAEVKGFQSRRFAGTYADLLAGGGPYQAAARFFLEELYSDKDYAERDAQFSRIAGAIEKLFPAQVADTAVGMAELHAVTEELDQAMALAWLDQPDECPGPRRYVLAWRDVARRADRENQLAVVMAIGEEMIRLAHLPGLRMMLKVMRGPAAAAGLKSLQRFLESGFETFAAMEKGKGGASGFLGTIRTRESALIQLLFEGNLVACETELTKALGQAL